MLKRLIGASSPVGMLKASLGDSSQAVKRIAHRVANASNGVQGDFASALEAAEAGQNSPVDLEAEMVALANEQLRYEASARLLQKVYQSLHAAVRGS